MRRTKLVVNSHCIPRMCVGVQYMCLKTFTPAGEIVHSSDLSNSNCFATKVYHIQTFPYLWRISGDVVENIDKDKK